MYGTAYIVGSDFDLTRWAAANLSGAAKFLAPHYSRMGDTAPLWRDGRRRRRVIAWVADEPSLMRGLVAAGVQAVTTNAPELCSVVCADPPPAR